MTEKSTSKMSAMTFLLRVSTLQAKIFELEARIYESRTLAEKCTTHLSPVAGGGHDDRRLENLVAQITLMEEEVRNMERQQAAARAEITDVLLQMENPQSIRILSERYLDLQTVSLIAKNHRFTLRYVYKLLRCAKAEFTRLYSSLPTK